MEGEEEEAEVILSHPSRLTPDGCPNPRGVHWIHAMHLRVAIVIDVYHRVKTLYAPPHPPLCRMIDSPPRCSEWRRVGFEWGGSDDDSE